MSKHEELIKSLRASAAAMPFDAAVAVQYRAAADALEAQAREIEAIWCPNEPDGASWAYKTEIPHVTFDIMEDGGIYCRGIVFALADMA